MLSLIVLCKSNLLLASMPLTDFLVGFLVHSLCVTLRASEMRHTHLCSVKMAYAFFRYVCSGASMLTLCFISLDRWFAITMPYRYIPEVIYNRYIAAVVLVKFPVKFAGNNTRNKLDSLSSSPFSNSQASSQQNSGACPTEH